MQVALLGPLDVRVDGAPARVGGAKQRTVLAALALSPGVVLPVEQVIAAVWGEDPPARSRETVQVYASNLRRVLGNDVLQYRSPGYVLLIAADAVDVGRFRTQMRAARIARHRGDLAAAGELLREALALWRGAPLSGLAPEGAISHEAVLLAAERTAAMEARLDVELELGGARELLRELQVLLSGNPLDEGLAARLMLALYRSGRQADALEVARRMRTRLADELGVDPGPQLRELEAAILAQSPDLLLPAARGGTADEPTTRWVPGRTGATLQLPGGRSVTLGDDPIILGRSDGCEVVLDHRSVSRRHAVIQPDDDAHAVVDLGSTNGTRVNGIAFPSGVARRLEDGDEIRVGAIRVRYSSSASG